MVFVEPGDIIWRHDGDGQFFEWQSTGLGFTQNVYGNTSLGSNWQISQAADYNDDGKADLFWRNTSDGTLAIWQSNGDGFDANAVYQTGVGLNWSIQAHDYAFG